MLTSIVGVVILLGGLIFFHELGHYTVAKIFGVKVEVFSLGFGKKIFSRQMGETQYCLSIIPFGGYVKLMGDDPYKGVPASEAERAFCTQQLYKRFCIVAAGPTSNLLLAYVLFTVVFFAGQPMVATRIGNVAIHSPSWEAGLRAKDNILEINGKKISHWIEIEDTLRPLAGQKVDLKIERGSQELRVPIEVSKVHLKNAYGEDEETGGIKGMTPNPSEPVVGISDPNSVAYIAGLRTGDTITKIENKPILVFEDIADTLSSLWVDNKPIIISYKRKPNLEIKEVPEQTVSLNLPKQSKVVSLFGVGTLLGIYPSELFVRQLSAGSPAEKGGLKVGDRIEKLGDGTVYNFEGIVDYIQAQGSQGQEAKLTIERDGKLVILNLKPSETSQEDPISGKKIKKYMIGLSPWAIYHEPDYTVFKIREPIALVKHAFHETNELARKMVISLVKLATGKISAKNLGGPVLIASVAGKSLDAGIIPFLQMMALISINLFLLNLFPIPVLDGGHLLFFILEAIKGKPVSIKTMEVANQIGMVFILMLVGLTLFNDVTRIILH
ncbi:MAG: RIP metalloprotease RseP [Deltaproteobacteria bacterium]|nr:RIP metalloprotease RseP [Deltaproteobacteria bacterium]